MRTCLSQGILTVTIDLEPEARRADVSDQRAMAQTADTLLRLLADQQVPATFAISEPAASMAAERILAAPQAHAIALKGDSTWVGRAAGRPRFGRELTRRIVSARAVGIEIATLVTKGVSMRDHFDLAVKQGVSAVLDQAPSSHDAAARLQPQSLHYGLWCFPVSCELPGRSRILPGGGGRRATCRNIDQAARSLGLLQLSVDAPRLAAAGRAALRALQRVLAHAANLRQEGVLACLTVADAARVLSSPAQSKPTRSILRGAA